MAGIGTDLFEKTEIPTYIEAKAADDEYGESVCRMVISDRREKQGSGKLCRRENF